MLLQDLRCGTWHKRYSIHAWLYCSSFPLCQLPQLAVLSVQMCTSQLLYHVDACLCIAHCSTCQLILNMASLVCC
jgi:hypothetical protein